MSACYLTGIFNGSSGIHRFVPVPHSLPHQNQRCRRIEIPDPTRSRFSGSSVTFFSCSQVRNNLGRPLDPSSVYGLCLCRNLTQLDGCMSRNATYCLYILTPYMSRNNATFNHQDCALSHSCLPCSCGMPCRRLRREMLNGMHELVSCNRALPMGVFKSM